jgi:C-terminal processing protease CtpA/Prc
VALRPFRVKDDPITGFPVSFNVESNPATARIARIIVAEVPPDSVTAQAGVKVGDEVIAINGRKTQEFAIGMGKNSELGQIFLNRDPGDEVTLEVRTPGAAKSRKVTISVARRSGPTFWGRR